MWTVEWAALSARIAGLIEAGGVYLTETIREPGQFDVSGDILQNARGVVERLQLLQANHAKTLPEAASGCLNQFLWRYGGSFAEPGGGPPRVQSVVTLLASFRAEFTYFVSDTEAVARSRVARAFAHLQRSIVADEGIRATWNKAFDKKATDGKSLAETACEQLGATHLLLHGIWAFKASGAQAQTDLVLGCLLDVDNDARPAADALVLTEWKVVRTESETASKAQEAYDQAQQYEGGLLAGFELASRRYLVLVSRNWLTNMPATRLDANVVYEHINVAVAPDPPSEYSRRPRTPLTS